MLKNRIPVFFTLMVFFAWVPMPAQGYEFNLGKHIDVFWKGDVTYTLRVRTENQDPNLVQDPFEMAELLFLSGRATQATVFYEMALERIATDESATSQDRASSSLMNRFDFGQKLIPIASGFSAFITLTMSWPSV